MTRVGYEVGKHFFGPKVLRHRFLAKQLPRIEKTQDLLRRRGGLGSLPRPLDGVPSRDDACARRFGSTCPIASSCSGTPSAGSPGATFVVLGNLAGSSYHLVAAKAGKYTAITLAVIVVVVLVGWHFRRERADRL